MPGRETTKTMDNGGGIMKMKTPLILTLAVVVLVPPGAEGNKMKNQPGRGSGTSTDADPISLISVRYTVA